MGVNGDDTGAGVTGVRQEARCQPWIRGGFWGLEESSGSKGGAGCGG